MLAIHHVNQLFSIGQVWIRMTAAKIIPGNAIDNGSIRCPEHLLKDHLGIRPGNSMHGIECHTEITRQEFANRIKIKDRLHKLCVIRNRIDHLNLHIPNLYRSDPVQSDVINFKDFVFTDIPGARKYRLGHPFRGRTTTADIIFNTEIFIRAGRIMAGRENEPAISLIFTNHT